MTQQKNLLQLIRFIDATASNSNLGYYAAYGTLLGAVREKDLIPWDEDADILVDAAIYDDFIAALKRNAGGEYDVYDSNTAGYEHLFARVTMHNKSHLHQSLDIFPLVGTPNNKILRLLFCTLAKVNFKIYFAKKVALKEYRARKVRGAQILLTKIIFALVPASVCKKIFEKQCKKYQIHHSEFVYNICGSYGKKEIIPLHWYRKTVRMALKDQAIHVPIEYHKILTQIYGDYSIRKQHNYI